MGHIRAYLIDGFWYHGVYCNGVLHLISRIGRVGDCVRVLISLSIINFRLQVIKIPGKFF